jgi:ABC-2 type transport system ATP-binding protein
MTQRFSLYEDLTVRENLEFLATVQGLPKTRVKSRVEELIEQYALIDQQKQIVGTLSGGQRQRLALAGAVVHEPELLFLDEPTSAVDPESRRSFWEKLFDLAVAGATLLVSTHYMDEAERCHRLAILDEGRLVADDAPATLMSALAGRAFAAQSQEPRRAQAVLAALSGVLSAAQIGNTLRVLVAAPDEDWPQRMSTALRAAGLQADIAPVTPNLEDVFVAATQMKRHNERAA